MKQTQIKKIRLAVMGGAILGLLFLVSMYRKRFEEGFGGALTVKTAPRRIFKLGVVAVMSTSGMK